MLDRLISEIEGRETSCTVYSDDPDGAVLDRLSGHGVAVRHRRLLAGQAAFVVIHEAEEYLGAVELGDLGEALTPPAVQPGSREDIPRAVRALSDALENTVFTALDRRQLLAASREIEDRAFRVGHGTLRVSFQSLSRFRRQTETYRYLCRNTALDVHVYGAADWSPPAIDGVTYHRTVADDVERFWAIGFDGGGDEMQVCGLLAREEDTGYTGFWTYDPETVSDIVAGLEAAE